MSLEECEAYCREMEAALSELKGRDSLVEAVGTSFLFSAFCIAVTSFGGGATAAPKQQHEGERLFLRSTTHAGVDLHRRCYRRDIHRRLIPKTAFSRLLMQCPPLPCATPQHFFPALIARIPCSLGVTP